MNERLLYEEQINQQLNELPLPDENRAWADMKRRLEEDDDDGVVVWWRRGCMLWGLLLLVLLATGWLLLQPEKWFNNKTVKNETNTEKQRDSSGLKINERDTVDLPTEEGAGEQPQPEKAMPLQTNADTNRQSEVVKKDKIPSLRQHEVAEGQVDITVIQPSRNIVSKKRNDRSGKDKNLQQLHQKPGNKITADTADQQTLLNKKSVMIDEAMGVAVNRNDSFDSKRNDSANKETKIDSLKRPGQRNDSAIVKTTAKTDSSEKKPIFFSAGIALHQQLPIAGQKLTPYNSLGRKGSIADYIPSVYFRVNKKERWFVQAEFRYGAPQYTKEFAYRQKIVPDTGQNPTLSTVTSSKLKKTYYHQLPLTFNYIVLPNWSVGAGIQWNRFYGLVSEKAVSIRDNLSQQDTVVSKVIIRESVDSATEFKKSYLLGVIETQYQWKRFSLGARYTFGLQPYIQFTLPGGSQQKERSQSIQVFLRYQLWRSKEK